MKMNLLRPSVLTTLTSVLAAGVLAGLPGVTSAAPPNSPTASSASLASEVVRPADGTFVATLGEGRVYQIVGGAPIYVDSWARVGGVKPYTWIDARIIREAGNDYRYDFNPPAVQSGLRHAPQDGTFIATYGEGRVYQFVGGSPVYVDSWAKVGGVKPYTWISPSAVANAGRDPWFNVYRQPTDNTVVATFGEGKVYQLVGGAPVYVDSWDAIGGFRSYTWVSPSVVAQAGSGPWSNLRRVPADGTPVSTAEPARDYIFVGGAALQVNNWRPPELPATVVSPSVVAGAGTGPWAEHRKLPRDGTFVVVRGQVFRFAGGQPMYVDSWAPYGGMQPYTVLPDSGITHGPVLDRPGPVDGTFVATPDGRVYRYAGGAPFYVTDWAPFGGPQPYTVVSSGAIDLAGVPGPWYDLPRVPANGTFVREAGGTAGYVMAGGAPIFVDDWTPWGGVQPAVDVSAQVVRTPGWGPWAGIRRAPADGTLVLAGTTFYRFEAGRLVTLPPDSWIATTVPTGLPAGAGAPPWAAILPPA